MHNIVIYGENNNFIDLIIKELNYVGLNESKIAYIVKNLRNKNEIIMRGVYNKTNIKIKLSDITYIQKERHGCIIHVIGEKSENDFDGKLIVREKLDKIYLKLKEFGFEYAHSSYIVNIEHVDECDKRQLKLDEGINLDISRSKSKQFNEQFINFFDAKDKNFTVFNQKWTEIVNCIVKKINNDIMYLISKQFINEKILK